jgi:acetyltransferase
MSSDVLQTAGEPSAQPGAPVSTYRLDRLFAPRSVALVGASPRPGSAGHALLANLERAGFDGPIHLVNPRHAEIGGRTCVPTLAAIGSVPEVAIIATPPETVPALVEEAAGIGIQAAIVVTGGLARGPGGALEQVALAARARGMRLVGPDCLGVIAPRAKFDASFSARLAPAGDLALITQSGGIAAAMIEWGHRNGAGFSAVVSLGEKVDVDFGDCLDHFAQDRATRAILLYLESLTDPQKFMSAARAAARAKPVVVVRAGRHRPRREPPRSHAGALASEDAVFDAAFRRAGLLRVYDLDELFSAAETLSRVGPFVGSRLGLLTNGGGLGVLAVDRLADFGGRLSELAPQTVERLDAALPPGWSRRNPVDIMGDADAGRYAAALEALLHDPGTDAVLVMNCPTALVSSRAIAAEVAATIKAYRAKSFRPRPVFAVWLDCDAEAGAGFDALKVPHYATEVDAVRGIMHLVQYRQAQDALMETPPNLPDTFSPDAGAARRIVEGALAAGRRWLDPVEVTRVLEAYQIPVAPVRPAATPEEAARLAAGFLDQGQAVALKVMSQQIAHKSDIGGVVLNLSSTSAVVQAARAMRERIATLRPDATLDGFTVQPMIHRPRGRELLAGLATDPTFGPVVVFGRGGTAVEIINDRALALTPLDMKLAQDLVARTRVHRLLLGYRDVPPADIDAVALVLVKIAQLAADIPEITELDLNPLTADEQGVIALDARLGVEAIPAGQRRRGPNPRFAVKPYPKQWERRLTLKDGWTVDVRPVRPEDERLYPDFFKHVTPEDLRLRFFAPVKEFSHAFIARLTQIDYARAIAFVALDHDTGELMGVVRLHTDPNHEEGEYAILLRSDLKGRGLGWALMKLMIDYARADGLRTVTGEILRENSTMIAMCQALGFTVGGSPDDPDLRIVTLELDKSLPQE